MDLLNIDAAQKFPGVDEEGWKGEQYEVSLVVLRVRLRVVVMAQSETASVEKTRHRVELAGFRRGPCRRHYSRWCSQAMLTGFTAETISKCE